MTIAFDLISDLHVESWPAKFDWQGLATSPYCIVAGDISRDRQTVVETLTHLGQCYQAVFYIDGNDEHRNYYENLSNSYRDLTRKISRIPNVVFLQDNVVVIEGVAIVGTNGWWGFDFDLGIDAEQSALWFQEKVNLTHWQTKTVARMANTDATYMMNSVSKLQAHQDVKHIVMVTHTVPNPELISHDIELNGTLRFNCMGNSNMAHTFFADHAKKIHTWCFGHYHGSVDQTRNGVRYVNNCRGRGDTVWRKAVYHPLRIEI